MVGKKNFCQNCEEICCSVSYVQISKEEIERFKDNIVCLDGIFFLKNVGGKCVFWKKNKCALSYADRPLSCKLYPIGFVLENGKPVVSIEKSCSLAKFVDMKKEEPLIRKAIELGLDKGIAISERDF
ncbi:MAG: YkgJ family cysteine cluster protein [Patescibacteria group bacterium]